MLRVKGFTLLEMLVAISVFTVVGVASYTTLNNIQRSEEISRERSAQLKKMQRVMTILERDLMQTTRRQVRVDEREPSKGFMWVAEFLLESEFDGMVLSRQGWRNPNAMLQRSTVQSIAYRVQENKLQRLYFIYPDAVSGTEPKESTLMEGVNGFKVSVYEEDTWQRPWESENIPHAVAVELDIEGLGLITRKFLLPGDGKSHRPTAGPDGGSGNSGQDDIGDSDSGGIPDEK
ncbi:MULTISPECIES: type II secretion system minor pseudopilin GspJ [Corallincola]|uniref:Type II secretion system protein J n=3 Tax=Corallincola TaxID=1775176 RepID=A0A368NKK5_9GAMM|nr:MULTISPECIES: type II secretion system minor pseudopilin GspJ [Corallincola]RCU51142.1 type II secretion system protein GspJ [Corallincola holothuriorum]TAA46074.1 type II secretion system protein GspJ [Corallincola spongiicola]TCI01438.1 type II secretion system protein GspJ [Corallincola luteus]